MSWHPSVFSSSSSTQTTTPDPAPSPTTPFKSDQKDHHSVSYFSKPDFSFEYPFKHAPAPTPPPSPTTPSTTTVYVDDNDASVWIPPSDVYTSTSTTITTNIKPPPLLFRVLVLDFFSKLSELCDLPIHDVLDIDFFVTGRQWITAGNILDRNSQAFDSWFIDCCKVPYVVERAWSLAFACASRTFFNYANLILCTNIDIRQNFVKLCASVYLDLRIESSQWSFRNRDQNHNTMTLRKREINKYEQDKAHLLSFFQSQLFRVRHVSNSVSLISIFHKSQFQYTDLSFNIATYDTLLNSSSSSKQQQTMDTTTTSSTIKTSRERLLDLERGSSMVPLGKEWTFHPDEVSVLQVIQRIHQSNDVDDGNNLPDLDLIVNNAYLRVLFAAAVGYTHRIRHFYTSLQHVPASMRDRIEKSRTSVTIQLAAAYKSTLVTRSKVFVR